MPTSIGRRAFGAALVAAPATARAQASDAFPSRPIRLIYPFATGAGDVIARAIAERLRETLGQSVVVDNRPGANTMIGAETAARAPKDGYTIGWVATSTLALNPHFYPNIAYRPEDFAPLCLVYRAPLAFAATAALPVRMLAEAVAHMRANPGLGVGTVGNGSSPHLMMELFQASAGVRAVNVAYRGEQPILADLVTGRIPFFAGSVATLLPHVEGGKFRILALSSPERLPALPETPTSARPAIRMRPTSTGTARRRRRARRCRSSGACRTPSRRRWAATWSAPAPRRTGGSTRCSSTRSGRSSAPTTSGSEG
jgi:tripartite-type tricarboxylate transporter receptor subunit TctC